MGWTCSLFHKSIYFQRHRGETFCSLLFHSSAHCCPEVATRFSQGCELYAIPCLFFRWRYIPYLYSFVKVLHLTTSLWHIIITPIHNQIPVCAFPLSFSHSAVCICSAFIILLPAAAPAEPGLRAEEQPEKTTTQPFNKTLSTSHLGLLCGSCSWY